MLLCDIINVENERMIFIMKKTLALILALTMVLCLVFTSCGKKNDENDNSDKTNQALLDYNTHLEDLLSEHQPKEELDKEVLATINGLPIAASTIRYANMAANAAYQGSDVSEEDLKIEIENFYRQNAALITLAHENNIEFTEDEITTNVKMYIAQMQLQYGEDYDKVFADSPFTKYFYYLYYTIYSPLFQKLIDVYSKDTESDFANEVRTEVLDTFAEGDYVRAKHILIQFPEGEGENGELTDEQKTQILEKANEVLEKVNAMADISEFDALIEEYNEDPGMETYPGGYYFTKGEMVPEFEEAAYALEEGKTSGLVETSYGYHILLKLPLNDENLTSSSVYMTTLSEKLGNHLMELGKSYDIVYSKEHDAKATEYVEEYKKIMGIDDEEAAGENTDIDSEADAEVEVETETETETETEAEVEAESEAK